MRDADPGRVLDPYRLADLGADAVEHGHGLVQVVVEDPRPDGVALGIGQRADDRDRGEAAGVQRQHVALVAQQHRRPLGGDPGHLAVRGVGEHLAGPILVDVRLVEQAHPELRLEHPAHARVQRLLAHRAGLQRLGQVAVRGIAHRHLHVEPDVQRAYAGIGQVLGEAVGEQVVHRVGVADHEALEPPGPAEHIGEQPAVARRRDAVEGHVGGHDVAGAGLDRGLERREVDVPELGVGDVDLVVVAATEGGAVAGEVLGPGDDPIRAPIRLPWKPRTWATATAAPRYGSSPAASVIRPQRGSRAMSIIGAKAQWMPTARASRAATA